jgi:hypothetical protein
MFKQLGEGWRWAKLKKAMEAATAAIDAGRIDIADHRLKEAAAILQNTKLPRTDHIEMITFWNMIGLVLNRDGHAQLAMHCENTAKLLQARFDAGEYYGDPGPTRSEQAEMHQRAEKQIREFFEKSPLPPK